MLQGDELNLLDAFVVFKRGIFGYYSIIIIELCAFILFCTPIKGPILLMLLRWIALPLAGNLRNFLHNWG